MRLQSFQRWEPDPDAKFERDFASSGLFAAALQFEFLAELWLLAALRLGAIS